MGKDFMPEGKNKHGFVMFINAEQQKQDFRATCCHPERQVLLFFFSFGKMLLNHILNVLQQNDSMHKDCLQWAAF